MTNKKNK